MLARQNRLGNSREFAGVYARGRQYRSPLVSLHVLARGLTEPRFGISVSKKVGGAVQRNLVKRRLREVCRRLMKIPAPPCDYVLVARQASLEADFEQLSAAVTRLVSQAMKEADSWTKHRQREPRFRPGTGVR